LHQQHFREGLHLGAVAQLGIGKGPLARHHSLPGRCDPSRGRLQLFPRLLHGGADATPGEVDVSGKHGSFALGQGCAVAGPATIKERLAKLQKPPQS
jgi:hypothetical protein